MSLLNITDDELALLGAARRLCGELSSRATTSSYRAEDALLEEGKRSYVTPSVAGYGRAAEAFYQAGDAIFDALNAASTYADVSMTEDQLHSREAPTAEELVRDEAFVATSDEADDSPFA